MNQDLVRQFIPLIIIGVLVILALHYLEPITATLKSPWGSLFNFSVIISIVIVVTLFWQIKENKR